MDEQSDMDFAPVDVTTTEGTEAAPSGDAPVAAPPADYTLFWFIILWVVVLYFFFMRPNRRKEKQRKEMVSAVQKGDKVVTIGGIYGVVMKVKDDSLTIRIDEKTGATLTCSRAAVNTVINKDEEI